MGLLQDWYDAFNFKKFFALCVCVAVLGCMILLVVAGVLTFNRQVGQNQYGVWINSFTQSISDVKSQGAYTIPLGSQMYLFERVLQDSGITQINCLTADGIEAQLDITIQYQYTEDEIIDTILLQFGSNGNFQGMLTTLLTSAVQDACGQYTALQYQNERALVDQSMQNSCQWKLGNASLLAQVLVQLKNIQLPDAYSELVAQKQTVDQSQTTALNNRITLLTQANTTLLNAQLAAQIPLIDANQTATVNLLNAYAQSNFTYQQWVERTLGLLSIKTANNLNTSGLLAYMRSQIVATSNNALLNL
jgi:hypothetical protein